MNKIVYIFIGFILWMIHSASFAFELITEQVTDNTYALVGEIGPRTVENNALNNTMGFFVTKQGIALIGSGASPLGAQLVEQAIKKVSSQPIRWVINIGAQDHHWLGNDYFSRKGAQIIALQRTVKAQQTHVDSHLLRLKALNKQQANSIVPVYAETPITSDEHILTLGDVEAHLLWLGGGHFYDDAVLWLPKQRVIFAGDLVFNDRLLDVQPFTDVLARQVAFQNMVKLQPRLVIPGHGHSGTLAKAQRNTGDYTAFLISNIKKALDEWQEIDDTVNQLSDAKSFEHLKFYNDWHKLNINRTYLQLERGCVDPSCK